MKEILDEIVMRLKVRYPTINIEEIVKSHMAGYVYSIWIDGIHICILRYLYVAAH